MNKVINGRKYDTDNAKALHSIRHRIPGDLEYYEETLYFDGGKYFLHGHGGPMSHYSVQVELNSWCSGSKIIPLSVQQAKEWCEEHLDGDEYEEIFGKIP